MDPELRQEARYVANLIDRGYINEAANTLRQDLYNLDEYSGRQLLAATRNFESPGGAELVVHRGRDQYNRPTDSLVVGIATPVQDNYGRSAWDVIDIATVGSQSRQSRQSYLRPDYYAGFDDGRSMLSSRSSGQFFSPRQEIWSNDTGYWTPGGVPRNNQETFNMPGSRFAFPITSSPWNYSTVGQSGWDYQDGPQFYRGPRGGRRYSTYRDDGYWGNDGFRGNGQYLAATMALSLLGALGSRMRY